MNLKIDEKILLIAKALCGEGIIEPLADCYQHNHDMKPICKRSDCCEINRLTEEQADYILSDKSMSSYLKACPGSGKTHVLGLKAAYEIGSWDDSNSGIAFLSFTRNAADEIRQMAMRFSNGQNVGFPHFIGTFDSWLQGYIFQPFAKKIHNYTGDSMRVLESSSEYDFLKNDKYQIRTKYMSQNGNRIPININCVHMNLQSAEWEIELSDNYKISIQDLYNALPQRFRTENPWLTTQTIQENVLEVKKTFWKDGFATYQDVEFICSLILSESDVMITIVKRFPIVYVDECQDLSYSELVLLKLLIDAGMKLHLIGDMNQAIYEFRQNAPEKIKQFISDNGLAEFNLSRNFRSEQRIVDCCSKLASSTQSIAGNPIDNQYEALLLMKYKNVPDCIEPFITILNERGISIAKSTIVARSRKLISDLHPTTSDNNYRNKTIIECIEALDNYMTLGATSQTLQDCLFKLGKLIGLKYYHSTRGSRFYYCPSDIDPSVWRCFLWGFIQHVITEFRSKTKPSKPMTVSIWINKVLNPCIESYSSKFPDGHVNLCKNNIFQAPNGTAKIKLSDICQKGNNPKVCKIDTTTIHQVKGKTFEAIMLVSASTAHGDGHYSKWVTGNIDEEPVRMAYVASSRPRKLLVWAVPNNINTCDEKRITNLGFTIR